MKDFFKIFIVLCGLVGAFFYGRNYGEVTQVESSEYKTMKSDNFNNQNAQTELSNLKEKFQKLLDSSDLKKSDEVLGKIMTIFLADLSLQLTTYQQKDLDVGKTKTETPIKSEVAVQTKANSKTETETEPEIKKPGIKNEGKFKAAEFEITEATSVDDIQRALGKLEVKKIDSLLDGAPESTFEQSKKFFGTYRGSLIDTTQKIYGTMVLKIQNMPAEKSPIQGSIKLFRNGVESVGSDFETMTLGNTPEKFVTTIIKFGSKGFIQTYKSDAMQKISGIYYERLNNGTTNTIGHFILSRTDLEE